MAIASTAHSATGAVAGQESPRSTFAAASIKPNRSGDLNMQVQFLPQRLVALNIPLRNLLSQAFAIPVERIRGGPNWLGADRFDVIATTETAATRRQINLMLRALLIDRFGVVVRRVSEAGSIAVLERARDRGKLGPNIRQSSDDCDLQGDGADGKSRCFLISGWGRVSSKKMTIGQLAGQLGAELGELVEDHTGLMGAFDIDLAWLPANANPVSASAAGIAERPSLDTALDEQLGLKVVRQKRAIEVLVVERVHKPTTD